jgi:anti-anti-sigma factor
MELKVCYEEGYVVAATIGAIDDSAREAFREWLHPLVGQGGAKLVLDLSESKYINSNGIGSLVSLVVHANTSGSRVVISACSPFVAVVLGRSKLDTFFNMAETVPDAIRMVLDQ